MADTAAHLVDCVLPEVPIRQWVLTLPYPLRYRCAYDAAFTSEILRAFLLALFCALCRRAKSQWDTPRRQCGSVIFIQRFGSALNLNLHFHTLALDGVYLSKNSSVTHFLPLPPPGVDEVARVLAGTARRIARLVASGAEGDDALARDEPLLATLAAASLRSRVALERHRVRSKDVVVWLEPLESFAIVGINSDAGVQAEALYTRARLPDPRLHSLDLDAIAEPHDRHPGADPCGNPMANRSVCAGRQQRLLLRQRVLLRRTVFLEQTPTNLWTKVTDPLRPPTTPSSFLARRRPADLPVSPRRGRLRRI